MNGIKPQRGIHRAYLMIVGGAALVAVFCAAFAATLAGTSSAAPNVAPSNTGEPAVSGTTRVGQALRTTRRLDRNRADRLPVPLVPLRRAGPSGRVELLSDHERKLERVRPSRGRRRIPDSVSGRRAERRRSGHCDVESDERRDLGAADEHGGAVDIRIGRRRKQAPGKPWPVGRRSADHLHVRLAPLQRQGRELQRDPGCERPGLRGARQRRRPDPRAGVARNDRGRTSAISNPTGVVGSSQPAPGSSVTVESLKAAGDRLVVSSVQFSPNPVTSRTAPITVRVRVTNRGVNPVRGALVFMRGTPRVVEGQTAATGSGRLGNSHPRAEPLVPAAAERLQRAVLHQGVPSGRPGARRHRRVPPRAGSPGGRIARAKGTRRPERPDGRLPLS